MEIRSFTLPEGEASQGFLSRCMEALCQARIELREESSLLDPVDNLVTAHLSTVLLAGLHPADRLVSRIYGPLVDIYDELKEIHPTHQRRQATLAYGRLVLLVHGLRLLGREGNFWRYHRLANLGYDCYIFAANTFRSTDVEGQTMQEVARGFRRYGELLGQAAIGLNFADCIDPHLLDYKPPE